MHKIGPMCSCLSYTVTGVVSSCYMCFVSIVAKVSHTLTSKVSGSLLSLSSSCHYVFVRLGDL